MLLEALSVGLIAAVAYKMYGGSTGPSTITGKLNQLIDNGYQYRDQTYTTELDLAHPDTKNNQAFMNEPITSDRGIFGAPRQYLQTLPGVTAVAQIYRNSNLIL